MTVDLRSDTVTRPSPAMRRAMAEAEVGDDVYGEDPTVARLESEAARRLGFEAAVFTPSGTMANQIALHLHARPGDVVLCERTSHIVRYEMGAMAALSGLQPQLLDGDEGRLDPDEVDAAITRDVPYQSRTGLVSVENTHNLAGGSVYEIERLRALVAVAHGRGLPIHMDGARVFNAATALGVEVAEVSRGFDTVSFCLSKGLGAPVGSLLCASRDLIVEARRVRKMLGGGMRQVGVLAAAGLVALEEGPGALLEDHANAARLGEGLGALPGVEVFGPQPGTNIVMCRLAPDAAARLVAGLADRDVLAIPLGTGRVRFVTHRDVGRADIETALAAAEECVGSPS